MPLNAIPHCKRLCIFVKKDEEVAVISVHCIGLVMLQGNSIKYDYKK